MAEHNNKISSLISIIQKINHEIMTIEDLDLKSQNVVTKIDELINQQIQQLENIKKLEITEQLLTVIIDILIKYIEELNQILSNYYSNLLDKYKRVYSVLLELDDEIERIKYLSLIKDKNVVLVGGNGSGKSSFASYLKESFSSNIVVIPAQKFLYFNKHIPRLHSMEKAEINSIQKENFIRRGRIHQEANYNQGIRKFTDDLSQLFSKFITVLSNEQISAEHKIINSTNKSLKLKEAKDGTILYQLNLLWGNLIPDIHFDVDTITRTLIPIKNGKKYTLNAMSDGEKAMLYYIAYVLLAEKNSFIVVDEPETFLNVSNFNRLWDALESFRPDCKFIYISHVVDFIVSRANTDLLWCKEFDYPNTWDIEPIDSDNNLTEEFPRELLPELLGARKSILFCEGEKSSLDYTIYSSLFKDEVIVYPVGGHTQVIQYTKLYNKLSANFNGNHAVGIIDADLMGDAQIQMYYEQNIYTLNFNEIEMLLLTEEVITDVLKHFNNSEELIQIIDEFKTEVIEVISQRIGKISFEKSKKYIDRKLSNFRISNSNTSEQIIEEINEWSDSLNLMDKSEQFEEEIKQRVKGEDYEKLLELCPLKDEITKGVANEYLDNDYMGRALKRIKQNEELSEKIKDKYFSDIMFK